MALDSTSTQTKTNNVLLTASLDRANALQIIDQTKPIDALELAFKFQIAPTVSIQTFAGWTLSASHMSLIGMGLVTWTVDRTGSVSQTFSGGGTSFDVTIVATQASTSTQKKKIIRVTVKPDGSGKGGGGGGGGDDDGPGHGHGHG